MFRLLDALPCPDLIKEFSLLSHHRSPYRLGSILNSLMASILLLGFSSLALAAPPEKHEAPLTHETVSLSLSRYETLFEASSSSMDHVSWLDPHLVIDIKQDGGGGEAWVSFDAQVILPKEPRKGTQVWADLVPAMIHPVEVWLNDLAQSPSVRGSFHSLPIDLTQAHTGTLRIRMQYPVRLGRGSQSELSGLLPLPPVANATVRIIGASSAQFIPPLPEQSLQHGAQVALRGALALSIPAAESGLYLQRQDLHVNLHPSGEGADIRLQIQTLLRGGVTQAWIPIAPAIDALLSAEVDGQAAIVAVRDKWHVAWAKGSGAHQVTATIRTTIDRSSGQPMLKLSPQGAPSATLSLTLPGEREVISTPALPMMSEVSRLPEPVMVGGEQLDKMTTVTAELPPLDHLTLKWTEKRATPAQEAPEFLSETYQLFALQEGLLKGQAQVELDVIKGELKRLEIEVPAGVVLYHLSGEGVEGWSTLPAEDGGGDKVARRVRVTFGEPRRGSSQLSLKWQRVLSNNETLAMPLIRPLNAFQESGVIALYDGDRVGFTPAKASKSDRGDERLIPVGQEAIPQRILQLKAGEKVSQAFRHVQAPTTLETATTTERARELRFDAQLDTLYSVRDGAVRAQAQLLVNLKSGRLDVLTFSLPKGCSEPQVSGPSINRVEPLPTSEEDITSTQRYQIRFTRRLEGAITLNIDAEQLIETDSAILTLPRIIVEGAELTQGHLGVTAEAGLEVTPATPIELRPVTLDELPRSISLRASTEVLYGYRFSRDWSLSANLKRHKLVETLNAEATALRIQSFLLESGQRVELAQYQVTNQDRRTIKVQLPPKATVQEVLVNQLAVRARAEGEMISIPVPKNQRSVVLLRYELPSEAGDAQSYRLISPSSDMRTTNITWELFFAQDRQLWSWEGELSEGEGSYASPINERYAFPRLTRSARFNFDLLPASRKPLNLKVSLRGLIPEWVMRRFAQLALLATLLIGLRRGLQFAKRETKRLRYPEWASGGILAVLFCLHLYQSSYYTLENYLESMLITLVVSVIAVWGFFTIKDGLKNYLERRAERLVSSLNDPIVEEFISEEAGQEEMDRPADHTTPQSSDDVEDVATEGGEV